MSILREHEALLAEGVLLTEKDDDEHFYGAWRGGSKASGGGPIRPGAPKARTPHVIRIDTSTPFHGPPKKEPVLVLSTKAKPKPEPAPKAGVLRGKPEEAKEALARTNLQRGNFQWSGYGRDSMQTMARMEGMETGAPWALRVNTEGRGRNFWFYDEHGRAVGNVEVRGDKIGQVTIRSDARGRGIGTQMYDRIQDEGHVNLYDLVGQSHEFTAAGKAFAAKWLQHRIKVEEERAGRPIKGQLPLFREASSDDHFYGPWFGGSRASGGGPGRGPTPEARRADMASKVGAENVGVPPQERGGASKPETPKDPYARFAILGDRGPAVGKDYGDNPDIAVKVVQSPTGHNAIASYHDDGHLELGKGTMQALDEHGARALWDAHIGPDGAYHYIGGPLAALPAGHVGVGGTAQTFAHEVGHGFQSQFAAVDLPYDGLGRMTDKGFEGPYLTLGGRSSTFIWRNSAEATADAFSFYALNPGQMAPSARAWVEDRLSERPAWRQMVERIREHPDPRYWAEKGHIGIHESVREASDDHFYGAWRGGSKAAGGHPAGGSASMSREKRAMLVGVAAAAARPFPSAPRRRRPPDVRFAHLETPKSPKEQAKAAAERVGRAGGWTHWGPAGGDAAVNTWLDEAYAKGAKKGGKEGSAPNTGDILHFRQYGEPSTMVAYRGPDGTRAGYVLFRAEPKRGIQSVSIMPSKQGRGLATAMYDWVQDHGGINIYDHIGALGDLTPSGKKFATAWLRHRIKVEADREKGIREAGDDHFYGAWRGGSKASGGGPVAKGGSAAPSATATGAAARAAEALPGMSAIDATRAISRLGIDVEGMEMAHPVLRAEMVLAAQQCAAVTPKGLRPMSIKVVDEATARRMGFMRNEAWATGGNVYFRDRAVSTTEAADRYGRSIGRGPYHDGMKQEELPRSAFGSWPSDFGGSTGYVMAHEWGHAVETAIGWRMRLQYPGTPPAFYEAKKVGGVWKRGKAMPGASQYGVSFGGTSSGMLSAKDSRLQERWAEGFVHYAAGLDTAPARWVREKVEGAS